LPACRHARAIAAASRRFQLTLLRAHIIMISN
jgi:hypothetical protein